MRTAFSLSIAREIAWRIPRRGRAAIRVETSNAFQPKQHISAEPYRLRAEYHCASPECRLRTKISKFVNKTG
jgi:hypothetical protein